MCPVDSLRTETKFKKTEIGEIPVDWKLVRLKDIVLSFINGGTPSTKVNSFWQGNIPWITGADFENQKIKKIRRYITEEAVNSSSTNIIPKESLLVVTRTGVGKLALAPFDIAISQDITGLIINSSKTSANYLFWYLINISERLKYLVQGTSINGMLREDLSNLVIACPPLPEQIKIGEILSKVDEAIEKKQEIIEKTKELKKGLMQELLTRGISHTKFKKTEIGDIPVDWEIVSTIDILKRTHRSIKIGPFGSQLKKEYFVQSGYKVYGQENVFSKDFTVGNRRIDKTRFDLLSSFQLYPGDVVITMMGTIGECAIVPDDIEPGIMDSHLLRLEIDEKKYSKELLVQLFSGSSIIKKQIKQLSVGGIMEGLSSNIVKKLIFPYPPIQEQKRIAGILLSADQDIQEEAEQEGNFEILKNGLADKLLAGKLRVFK